MVSSAVDARCLQRAHTIRMLSGVTGVLSAFLSLVTLAFDLDIQTYPSEGPNILPVNLAQIRSAVPEIFEAQTKKKQTSHRRR